MKYKYFIGALAVCFMSMACSSKSSETDISQTEEKNITTKEPTEEEIVETPNIEGGMYIVISKETMKLCLYDSKSKLVKKYTIACGKELGDKKGRGDNCTPEGVFKIQAIQDASNWDHDFNDSKGVIKGAYGPKFIRLHTPPHTGIGIHGTHDPASLGKRASEGCIRMNNQDVAELSKYAYTDMPVIILSSMEDLKATIKDNKPRTTIDVTSIGNKSKSASVKIQTTVPEPKIEKPSKTTKSKQSKAVESTTHTVVKGDRVSTIAKKYEITEEQLCKLNRLKDNKIKLGQKL
ncbi:MAG: L,D-transpeptidase family protein, partial [Rikenellaceae bacterium]